MWLPPADLSRLCPFRSFLFDDLADPELLDLKDTWELTCEPKIPSPCVVRWKLFGTLMPLALVKSIAADAFFDLPDFFLPLLFGLAWKDSPEPPELSRFLLNGYFPWLS